MSHKTLLMCLAGPMQSWGTSSRFTRRATDDAPSKSGVLGMLAAAKGIRRTEPLTELLGVRFGVRIDQPGSMLRDFQTSRPLDDVNANATLAERFYLADAVFLAAVEGDVSLIDGLAEALARPRYQLFLGRRSCPPAGPVLIETQRRSMESALYEHEWLAAKHHRRKHGPEVRLHVVRDATPGETGDIVRDEPVSFDPRHREYGWRQVVRKPVTVPNPDARPQGPESDGPAESHDPFAFFGD